MQIIVSVSLGTLDCAKCLSHILALWERIWILTVAWIESQLRWVKCGSSHPRITLFGHLLALKRLLEGIKRAWEVLFGIILRCLGVHSNSNPKFSLYKLSSNLEGLHCTIQSHSIINWSQFKSNQIWEPISEPCQIKISRNSRSKHPPYLL